MRLVYLWHEIWEVEPLQIWPLVTFIVHFKLNLYMSLSLFKFDVKFIIYFIYLLLYSTSAEGLKLNISSKKQVDNCCKCFSLFCFKGTFIYTS